VRWTWSGVHPLAKVAVAGVRWDAPKRRTVAIHCIARSGIRPDAHDSAGEQRTVREGDAFTIFYQEIASRAVNRTTMTGHPGVRSGRLPQYPVTDGTDERAWPVWTARCPMRTLLRLGVHYRNRSPGRRPLVGCSHRCEARPI
jgi:hypothetical protein